MLITVTYTIYPCAVRHQFRIVMNSAASTVDLSPPRHPTAPTISTLGVLHVFVTLDKRDLSRCRVSAFCRFPETGPRGKSLGQALTGGRTRVRA
jgi:hypothetical protein